ncbi:tetratricopeptide repeat protein [Spirillospora sp. CA-128828]|uniref:tetratricopeptide repeat protein n=1 Tax=Spirillospora sp. CA-128828 TaxID=3240033 RepID=UPI003D92E4C1
MPDDGQAPSVRQEVTAVAGFAYGAIGADIHCLGDGTPLYVLDNWRPPPEPAPDFLRELPSRMLNARFAVVDFTGREGELADLEQWRAQPTRLATRWLYGPAGQGKTRLAAQFAQESIEQGWKVVTATHGPGTVLPPPGSQDLRLDEAAGLLLIIDYADRWPLSHLTWLLSNALLHQPAVRTRVLMLGRGIDVWPAIRAALANQQASTSAQALPPLPGDGRDTGARATMFNAARDGFADRYGTEASAIGPLKTLEHPDFGLVLAVHMAALVAVDAHATGRTPPGDMESLTIYLLDREHLHWANLYNSVAAKLDTVSPTYRTPPETMNQTVFTAVLTGPQPRPLGLSVLTALQPSTASEQTLTDHALCYPAATQTQQTVLEPLYPDRLAEDFLALTLPGHQAHYPAHDWAAATVNTLLSHQGILAGAPPSRAVTFLATAARRWPHLGPGYLYPLVHRNPGLAVAAGSAALIALAEIPDVDWTVLAAVEREFPAQQHVDLDTAMAVLSARVAHHRLQAARDPLERLSVLSDLGVRQSNAGLYQEALETTLREVEECRRVASGTPGGAVRYLGLSLLNLGKRLASVGRDQEALNATQEAVDLLRRAAVADPEFFEPFVAKALVNMGAQFADLGRPEESLAVTREAVDLLQRLASADPDAREPDLAAALNNLSTILAKAGGLAEDALAVAEQAAGLLGRFAAAQPATYQPHLAVVLTTYAQALKEGGRPEQSLSVAQGAVDLLRQLAEANPNAYQAQFADALDQLAVSLAESDRMQDALEVFQEAARVRRRLGDGSGIARALTNLGIHLKRMGRSEEALAIAMPAVDIDPQVIDQHPDGFEPHFETLYSHSLQLAQAGRYEDALAATQQAVDLCRRLAAADPDTYVPDLAKALNNHGIRLAEIGRHKEALASTRQAVAIDKRLAAADPAIHEPSLALSLDNLGIRLADRGRRFKALKATRQSVDIRRRLAQADPATHEGDLALALHNLGIRYIKLGRLNKAAEATGQAVDIRRRLVRDDPARRADLAMSLTNLGAILGATTRREEGLATLQEAVELYRRLAEDDPAYQSLLVYALRGLAKGLIQLGRAKEANAVGREAAELSHHIADTGSAITPSRRRSAAPTYIRPLPQSTQSPDTPPLH